MEIFFFVDPQTSIHSIMGIQFAIGFSQWTWQDFETVWALAQLRLWWDCVLLG